MKNMWKLKETLCEQLEEYTSRTKLAGGDLQTVHMLSDTIKNLDKIEMLEDEEMDEYSHARRRRDMRGRYSRTGDRYSYDEDGDNYANGMGGGNYSRNRGYSRDDGKDRVVEVLESMMDGVQGPERQTIQRMLDMANKL